MQYVYIIKSINSINIYIGFTADLKRRVNQHNNGKPQSTKANRHWRVVYYEAYSSKRDAFEREKQLKRFAKAYGQLKGRIKFSLLNEG